VERCNSVGLAVDPDERVLRQARAEGVSIALLWSRRRSRRAGVATEDGTFVCPTRLAIDPDEQVLRLAMPGVRATTRVFGLAVDPDELVLRPSRDA
jgi:hypothetical protein